MTEFTSAGVHELVRESDGDTRVALFALATAFEDLMQRFEQHLADCPHVASPEPRPEQIAFPIRDGRLYERLAEITIDREGPHTR